MTLEFGGIGWRTTIWRRHYCFEKEHRRFGSHASTLDKAVTELGPYQVCRRLCLPAAPTASSQPRPLEPHIGMLPRRDRRLGLVPRPWWAGPRQARGPTGSKARRHRRRRSDRRRSPRRAAPKTGASTGRVLQRPRRGECERPSSGGTGTTRTKGGRQIRKGWRWRSRLLGPCSRT